MKAPCSLMPIAPAILRAISLPLGSRAGGLQRGLAKLVVADTRHRLSRAVPHNFVTQRKTQPKNAMHFAPMEWRALQP
jgi:hypothetical protein